MADDNPDRTSGESARDSFANVTAGVVVFAACAFAEVAPGTQRRSPSYPRDRASARFAEHRAALLGDFALNGLSQRPDSPRADSVRTNPPEEKHHA